LACWVCGSTAHKVWKPRSFPRALHPGDLQITDSRYGQTLTLRKCADCGFIFTDDGEVAELVALYERLDDPGYEATQDTRSLQMRWLLGRTLSARPLARTWLDIGAGAGLLVAEAQRRGLDAAGVEPSHALVAAASALNGVALLQGTFPHPALAGRKFDVISLVDVIEHVSVPVALLSQCREALTPEGVLLVVTPDVGSFLAHRLGPRWWHFRLAHVGYFDRASLGCAAARAGLAPMAWFRARWFFRIHYLAKRMEAYLPVGLWNRFALRVPPLAWLYQRIIPLNLFDSWVVLLGSANPPDQFHQ
jgi:SAM-dependent methyltransferase